MGRSGWRRLGWRVGAAVVLGVMTTVGVAWALAFRDVSGFAGIGSVRVIEADDHLRNDPMGVPGGVVTVGRFEGTGSLFVKGVAAGPSTLPIPGIPLTGVFEQPPPPTPNELLPSWMVRAAAPWVGGFEPMPRGADRDDRSVSAQGWPRLALYTVSERRPDTGDVIRWGVRVPWHATRQVGGPFGRVSDVVLPWRPVWGGVAINVACYGAVWMVVLYGVSGVKGVRRWRRRGRGQCERCGYDLKGSGAGVKCPECGRGA